MAGLLAATNSGLLGGSDDPEGEQLALSNVLNTIIHGAGLVKQMVPPMGPSPSALPPALPANKVLTEPNDQAAYPGIFANPRTIAEKAAAQTAPEDPALKQMFGVTRDDLYNMSLRQGNQEPAFTPNPNARGSAVAAKVMTPANAQRLQDTISETSLRAPDLFKGMHAWYVMDPAYQRLVQLVGPEQATREYTRLLGMGFYSPASNVNTEINRGTGAGMAWQQGMFDPWIQYGGKPPAQRPDSMAPFAAVGGHMAHSTAMAPQSGRFFGAADQGLLGAIRAAGMNDPKVQLYVHSSGTPETGFQTVLPVPDSHFARGVGMAEVRPWVNEDGKLVPNAKHMKAGEYNTFGPWYYNNVSRPLGIESVPAQAIQWGALGPVTGVDTLIGAPKLELFSRRILDEATKQGLDPLWYRDQVLLGNKHAELEPNQNVGLT